MIQSKNITDKLYCSSPFNSIFLEIGGNVSSCCAGSHRWGNLKDSNLKDILLSDTPNKIRKDVLNGVPNSYCSTCFYNEKKQASSQRGHFSKLEVDISKPFQLKTLDLRWSSICNFSCVYCSEQFSSAWAKKKGLSANTENLKIQNRIFDYLEKYGDGVEKIMLAGGEPLLQTQNNRMLDLIPNKTQITIISNLGVDLQKSIIFQKLSKMPNVLWAISLENIGEQFEWVRQGGNWEIMKNNIKYIKDNTSHEMNFLSVFNVFSLTQIHEFVDFAESIGVNIMWQSIFGVGDILDVDKYSPKVIKYFLEILKTLNLNRNIQFGEDFIKQTIFKLENILDTNLVTVYNDDELIEFVEGNESHYNETSTKFSDLWPELNNLLINNK